MKILVNLFIYFFFANGISQTITFSLFSINPCEQNVDKISFFTLEKNQDIFNAEDGKIILSEPGVYELRFVGDFVDASNKRTYKIDLTKNVNDTLPKFRVEEIFNDATSTFYCCGAKCNGKITEYFQNGKIRIKGFFRDGKRIKKYREYYANGNLRKIRIYNSTGKLKSIKEFDEFGNLTGKVKYKK